MGWFDIISDVTSAHVRIYYSLDHQSFSAHNIEKTGKGLHGDEASCTYNSISTARWFQLMIAAASTVYIAVLYGIASNII